MATEPHQNLKPTHVSPEPNAVQARQGVISGRVFLVLVTSVLLAVVALAISYFVVR
jgi:hypothetical protein